MAESLIAAKARFLPSLAMLTGVDGVVLGVFTIFRGIAVGRARKNRCEYLYVSSILTTTAAAPAV